MAPEITQQLLFGSRDGHWLSGISDDIDLVNAFTTVKNSRFNDDSQFDTEKDKAKFRQYLNASERVKSFYREQHEKQTVAYNLKARINFKSKKKAKMTVWEAMEKLNTLIDESDPDTSLSQIEHLLQTAEAIRRDGKPRWMQVTGLIHDLGKLLFFFDAEGQWDVVGDTFPGMARDKINLYQVRCKRTTANNKFELQLDVHLTTELFFQRPSRIIRTITTQFIVLSLGYIMKAAA